MSAETALRATLVAHTATAALVGQRVRAERAEQDDVRPFVIFTRTASEPYNTVDGAVLATLVSLDVQCWADTRTGADALADAVSAAIRAVPTQSVAGRSSGYDADLDLEVTNLNILWWE